jgi:hypothetical protein
MSNIPYLRQLDDNSTVIAKDLTAMATALSTIPASFNIYTLYESGVIYDFGSSNAQSQVPYPITFSNVVVNIIGLGEPTRYKSLTLGQRSIAQIKNANLLTNLEDVGTLSALILHSNSLTAIEINSLFAQLPKTTKTATINISNNSGTATCNTSIATSKGYTVII